MLSTIISWLLVAFFAVLVPALSLLAAVLGVMRFFRELKRIRLSDGLDEVAVPEYPTDRAGIQDVRDAAQLLLAAEGGFVHAQRRLFWEMFPGGGDPDLRHATLTTAVGELLLARQAVRQAALKLPQLGLELDESEVPAFNDPVQSLAARGNWPGWAILTILPRFMRAMYSYRSIKRQSAELLEHTRDLMEQIEGVRKTVEPAPVRRMPLARRAELAVAM